MRGSIGEPVMMPAPIELRSNELWGSIPKDIHHTCHTELVEVRPLKNNKTL